MSAWTPIVKTHLSSNELNLISICKQEPHYERSADLMKLYTRQTSCLEFIKKWKHSFSPYAINKLTALENSIDFEIRARSLLFISKLKLRMNPQPVSTKQPVFLDFKTLNTKPTFERQKVSQTYDIQDKYVEDTFKKFIASLRE